MYYTGNYFVWNHLVISLSSLIHWWTNFILYFKYFLYINLYARKFLNPQNDTKLSRNLVTEKILSFYWPDIHGQYEEGQIHILQIWGCQSFNSSCLQFVHIFLVRSPYKVFHSLHKTDNFCSLLLNDSVGNKNSMLQQWFFVSLLVNFSIFKQKRNIFI